VDRNDTSPTALAHRSPTRLEHRVVAALRTASETGDERPLEQLGAATPTDRRDGLATLGVIHDLSLAPIDQLGGDERWQHHPAVATLRQALEAALVDHLETMAPALDGDGGEGEDSTAAGAVAGMRRLAHADAVPEIYRWLATTATEGELIDFLSLEGGPDGGFDDLVALAQVGLGGRPKLELARNYWDEMGRGHLDDVHTALHERLAAALGLRAVPRSEQPEEALLRSVLGSFLVLSRAHQPEAVGALGLVELQAGPRCRWVLRALDRLGVAPDAWPFYVEHAEADPRHGRDWLDGVVAELAEEPRWAVGMLRGARWRAAVSEQFFRAALQWFVPSAVAGPTGHRLPSPAAGALRAG
jgi:hypothetical protein